MKKKNKLRLHPALVFLILTLLVMVISCLGKILNLEASYYSVNEVTGDLTSQVVTINNLFNRTGLQYLISNMLNNFINFAPLGNLIIGLLGVGVAYKSGFLNSLFKMIAEKVPRRFLTFMVVFLGILFSMLYQVGYVILIPLAAILFMNIGRHPGAGICAAFSGITFGYGANFIINKLDSTLVSYASKSAKILDSSYVIHLTGNIVFTTVSTILLAYVGMIVTERFIIPKLGKYYFDEEEPSQNGVVSKRERKGVILSIGATCIVLLLLAYCLIKGLPFSGLLLDLSQNKYIDMLFGEGSYFYKGSVTIFSFILMFSGLIYGIGHAIYTKSDPRALLIHEQCEALAKSKGQEEIYNCIHAFEKVAIEVMKERKGIEVCANVDYYSGYVYSLLGIEADLFTPLFAISRTAGWVSHHLENRQSNRKLIRPANVYVGEMEEIK